MDPQKTNEATTVPIAEPRRQSRRATELDEDDEDREENTCCHRATICNPRIRGILVTEAVSSCFGRTLTWAHLFWMATSSGLVLIGWAVFYFILGDTMLPTGPIFGLYILIIFSYVLGWTLAYIPRLNIPPVFGMLLAGIILRNTGFYDIQEQLGVGSTAKIRTFCLTFIMIRAGLQLTTTALRKHSYFILVLAIVPCSIEGLVLCACCRYVLLYPWDWSFMTGTIVACMSPVITINCILALAERGYGEDKGLATLLCTAAAIDGVHIVSLFSICYSWVFGSDRNRMEWWTYIPGGIRDVMLGVLAGIVLGICLTFFPHRNHKHVLWYRILGLVFGSLMCTTAASRLAVSGGGYLATVIMSFIAITGWRILSSSFDSTPFRKAAYYMWHLMQPILVGVIAADIDFRDWSLSRLKLHIASIVVGLVARSASTFLVTMRTALTWRERIFVAISWLPKGTIQAALAPIAFERARKEGDPTKIDLALDIVKISVVAVIFLAPLGAIAMATSGPFLLNRITVEEHQRERELSYLRILSLQPVRTLKTRREISENPVVT